MEQFEKIIQKNRETVANRIRKSLDIELQLSEEETESKAVKKAFVDDLSSVYNKAISHEEFWEEMQKAHQDGDMHPNGKWVWRSSANGGKGDWRVASPSKHGGGTKTTAAASTSKISTEKKDNKRTEISVEDLIGNQPVVRGSSGLASKQIWETAYYFIEDFLKNPKMKINESNLLSQSISILQRKSMWNKRAKFAAENYVVPKVKNAIKKYEDTMKQQEPSKATTSSVKSSEKEEKTGSKIDDHAKNASDEALKKVIQSENASDELKAAAKKELKNREKESSSDSKKDEFEFKSRPGHKTGKFIQGDGYSVAYAKYGDDRYVVMTNLNYEDKAGEEMIIGLKGDVSSLKEAKELSMKIAKDLKDKKVMDTLRNMEKDFIFKTKKITATQIRKFEYSWEDVLKASKEE